MVTAALPFAIPGPALGASADGPGRTREGCVNGRGDAMAYEGQATSMARSHGPFCFLLHFSPLNGKRLQHLSQNGRQG
jgi:hypothetical protein